MNGVFLDTNVLIDFLLGRGSAKDVSRLLALCQERDLLVMVSNLSLKDVFYLVEKTIKAQARADHGGMLSEADAAAARQIAWSCVKSVGEFAKVVGSTYAEYREACLLEPLHDDFEDDLVVSCAIHYGADVLVTSDERLITHAPVACLTPSDAVLAIEALQG